MMQHWVAITAFLLASGASNPAFTAGRDPVCREPAVVDEMTREIRGRLYYADVDARLVTEQATADPRVVRCQVCVQMAPYSMLRFGERPIEQCAAHGFEVRILPKGFVVRDLR